MSQCTQCNAELPDDAHFCPTCGAEYHEPVAPRCRKCDAEMPEDAHFCPSCGAETIPTIDLTPTVTGFTASSRRGQAAAQQRANRRSRKQIAIIAGAAVAGLAIAAVVIIPLVVKGSVNGVLISDADGSPISGGIIKTSAGTAVTTPTGRFHIEGLRPGNARATVVVAGLGPYTTALNVGLTGNAEQRVSVPCASCAIKLSEVAPRPGKVAEATVRVAGTTAVADASGVYRVNALRPGKALVEASGASYEQTQGLVQLTSGKNQLPLTLTLTPKATFLRYIDAFQAKDWKTAYAYLAPEIRSHYGFAAFKTDMLNWGTPLSVEVTNVKIGSWESPTGKKYDHVASITRTLVGERRGGGRYKSTATQHWVSVGGSWFRIDR